MRNKKLGTKVKNCLLAIIFFIIAFNLLPCESEAKLRNLIDDLDYPTLSVEEVQQEVALLYKFAKKAYSDNDLELAKLFFYQILELDPEHPGANKYIEYYLPKKSYQLKAKQFDKQKQVVDFDFKQEDLLGTQGESRKDSKEQLITTQKEEKIKEKLAKRDLKKEVAKEKKLTPKQKKAIAAKQRKQEVIQKREQASIEGEKRKAEARKAKIVAAEERKQEKLREKELKQIVREEKRKRKLEIAQRKKYEAEQKRQEAILKREQERIEREKRLAEKREARRIVAKKSKKEEGRILLQEEKKLVQEEPIEKKEAIQLKDSIIVVDPSTLSAQEMRKKIARLYNSAKQAYSKNDLELAKSIFYQILELDFEHPGANKYIDYYIPKKYYQINMEQLKKQERAAESKMKYVELSEKPEAPSSIEPIKQQGPTVIKDEKKDLSVDKDQKKQLRVVEDEKKQLSVVEKKPKQVKKAEKKAPRETKVAKKTDKQKVADSQEDLLKQIVKEEFALIQEEQKRVAKEEELRKKAQKRQAEKKEESKRTISSRENVLPLAKLSKEVKEEIIETKPKEIKTEMVDKQKENLQKYLLWQKKIAELRNKTKKPSTEAPSVQVPVIERPKQEEVKKIEQQEIAKITEQVTKEEEASEPIDESEGIFQEGDWGKIKSLYKEGIYSYRAGEYDNAQESFEKILQQN